MLVTDYKKVAVIQPNLSIGGSSVVSLAFVDFLNEQGIIPDIFAYDAAETNRIRQGFGQSLKYNLIVVGNKRGMRWGAYYLNYWLASLRPLLREYDLVFNSFNFWAFLPRDINCINYIHFPGFAWESVYKEGGFIKQLYWLPLKFLHLNYYRPINHKFLVNSSFTQKVMLSSLGNKGNSYDIEVVYPPVNIASFWSEKPLAQRRKAVVSLGRFSPEKRQIMQIDLAKEFPEVEFILIGQTGNGSSHSYYQQCVSLVQKLGLTNVHFLANASFKTVINQMHSARFFLHTMDMEHFGIAAVEAIASGCIPIVPNSGGQKEIVPFADQRFTNLKEAQHLFALLLSMPTHDLEARRVELQNHVHLFSQSEFKRRVTETVLNF